MIVPTRLRGFSEAYGSWKTICISRRMRAQRAPRQLGDVRPSNVTVPAVSSCSRMMHRPSVDLPQPDSPTRPSVSPGPDLEADVVDRVHPADLALDDDAVLDREVLLDVLDAQQHFPVVGHFPVVARGHAGSSDSSGWIARSRCVPLLGHGPGGRRPDGRRRPCLSARGPRSRQRSNRCGQRGPNAQPSGRLSIDGGRPSIAVSRRGRGRSSRAIDPSRPQVYGCWAS